MRPLSGKDEGAEQQPQSPAPEQQGEARGEEHGHAMLELHASESVATDVSDQEDRDHDRE